MTTPPQPGLVALAYLCAVIAAGMGIALARQRAEHRPIALFLSVMAAIDLVRFGLARLVDFAEATRPHVGMVRLAFHVDELGFLAWPAGLIALALVVFVGFRRLWVVLAAWALVGAVLVALYPSDLVRGVGLQRVYLAAHLAAMAALIASLAAWGAKRVAPASEHAVLFMIGALEVARLVPFNGSVFERWSAYAPATDTVLYGLISVIQGGFLWSSSRSS